MQSRRSGYDARDRHLPESRRLLGRRVRRDAGRRCPTSWWYSSCAENDRSARPRHYHVPAADAGAAGPRQHGRTENAAARIAAARPSDQRPSVPSRWPGSVYPRCVHGRLQADVSRYRRLQRGLFPILRGRMAGARLGETRPGTTARHYSVVHAPRSQLDGPDSRLRGGRAVSVARHALPFLIPSTRRVCGPVVHSGHSVTSPTHSWATGTSSVPAQLDGRLVPRGHPGLGPWLISESNGRSTPAIHGKWSVIPDPARCRDVDLR